MNQPPDTDTTDSGVDTDMSSDWMSVNSQNYEFREEKGRRLHGIADAPYSVAVDRGEVPRLHDLHYWHKTYFGNNILAPLPARPTLIVDIGTGAGIWSIEVADQYPSCQVIGTDLAPIQTTEAPPNWIPRAKWPEFVAEVYRVLKPGTGWAAFIEVNIMFGSDDGTLRDDSHVRQWHRMLYEMHGKKGVDCTVADAALEQFVREQPFVDVRVEHIKMPIGLWPADAKGKRIGRLSLSVFGTGVESCEVLLRQWRPEWGDEKVGEFMKGAQADIGNPEIHAYCPL